MNWLKKILLFFNFIAALLLLATLFNAWVNPNQWWIFSFLGLGFPYLVILNFMFLLFWIFNKKWWLLLSLCAILCNYFNIKNSVAFGSSKPFQPTDSNIIKVMSFNVRVFDLYEYDDKKNQLENILTTLKTEHPNIVCLQEFYSSDDKRQKNYNTIKRLTEECGYKYFHFYNSSTLRKTDHWGMAVFSDYEIKSATDIDFGIHTENEACYCDVLIHKKNYRVITTHLQSVYFGKKDYKYLDNLQLNDDEDVNAGKRILRKLKRGFMRRAQQAETIGKLVNESPYPIILCGDFNDTPASYAYHAIGKKLNDDFLEAGNGLGTSYVSKFPFLRIDYILTDKQLQVMQFKTMNEKTLSDHYPVMSWIKLN